MGVKRARFDSSPVPPIVADRECDDGDDIDTPRFGHDDRKHHTPVPVTTLKSNSSAGIFKRIGLALLGNKKQIEEFSEASGDDDDDFDDDESVSRGATSPDRGYDENTSHNSIPSDVCTRDDTGNGSLVNPLTIHVADVDESTGVPSFCFLPDFASAAMGGRVIYATDEFYGLAQNMLAGLPADGKVPGDIIRCTQFGEVRDAWLPRRRRTPGHEFCIIELAETAYLRGFDIDIGSLAEGCPRASIEGGSFVDLVSDLQTYLEERQHAENKIDTPANKRTKTLQIRQTLMGPPLPQSFYRDVDTFLDQKEWFEILPVHTLTEGHNWFAVTPSHDEDRRVSHLRLNLFPDGGVVRFRAYGETLVALPLLFLLEAEAANKALNFLNPCLGGWPLWASSNKARNLPSLVSATEAKSYADGWCSTRVPIRPPAVFATKQDGPSFGASESLLFKLAARGIPKEFLLDTAFHLGDAPFAITVEAVDCPHLMKISLLQQIEFFKLLGGENLRWATLIDQCEVSPHCLHHFKFVHKVPRASRSPKSARSPKVSPPETIVELCSDEDDEVEELKHSKKTLHIPIEEVACTHVRIRLIPDGGLSRVSMLCQLPSAAGEVARPDGSMSHSTPFTGPLSTKRRGRRRSTVALFNSLQQSAKHA
eukprot:Blabericola_migrator_1__3551@NODE_2053_length_3353_cov_218_206634_g50_i1_p1_GENE_NODE_2053_length_3353_cov_218_206634_g50_i1NODE_2053_length_3353_cov_218_206634_g50_i1_p1_ORF_typecomplete_len651_score143_30Allantoicase/PF03561_15/2_7e26Allantoicase/PF03561_15/1_7e11_NODE_2053_length_3353_cov_218_206634_g50_i12812233